MINTVTRSDVLYHVECIFLDQSRPITRDAERRVFMMRKTIRDQMRQIKLL